MPDDELRRLHEDLYRRGADSDTVHRYQAALEERSTPGTIAAPPPLAVRRAYRASVLLAALIVLAGVVMTVMSSAVTTDRAVPLARGALASATELRWSWWPISSAAQHEQLIRALPVPDRLLRILRARPGLVPMHGAPSLVVSSITSPVVTLDEFGPVVGPSSEVVIVIHCGRATGAFRLQLSTLVQKDAAVQVAPLAVTRGRCSGGASAVRYRPLLGVLPTSADLQAPTGSAMAVILTG